MPSSHTTEPGSPQHGFPWRKLYILLFKISVSAIVLYILVQSLDFNMLKTRLTTDSMLPLLTGVAIGAFMLIVAGLRWRAIHIGMRMTLPRGFSVAATMEAYTYNLILPGSIGGDVLRIARATRVTGRLREELIAGVADRGANLAALILFSITVLPFISTMESGAALVWATALLASIGFIGGGAVLLVPALHRLPKLRRIGLIREMIRVGLIARRFLRSMSAVVNVTILSLLVQGMNVILLWTGAVAMGEWHIPGYALILATTFGLLASAIPVSVAGLGVREGAVVWVLVEAGIDQQVALIVALMFGTLVISQALPGIIVIMSGKLPPLRSPKPV